MHSSVSRLWTVFLNNSACSNQHPSLTSELNLKFRTLEEMFKMNIAAYGTAASDSRKTSRKPGVAREQFAYIGWGHRVLSLRDFHCSTIGILNPALFYT